MRIYNLLPEIIRTRDQLQKGAEDEGTFQKVIFAVEQVLRETKVDIDGLTDLPDVDETAEEHLPRLAGLLGLSMDGDWSADKQRFFIRSVVALLKLKGTQRSWNAQLKLRGRPGYFPWELWKKDVFEIDDYSLFKDYDHQIKAARVDVRTIVDGDTNPDINNEIAAQSYIESVRPVHVLIRRRVDKAEGDDDFLLAIDSSPYSDDSRLNFTFTESTALPADAGITVTKIDKGFNLGGEEIFADATFEHHARRHQAGGKDQLNLEGVPGELSDPQTPKAHAASHEKGGSDEITLESLAATSVDTSLVLKPDGAGGVEFGVDAGGGGGGQHFEETFTATTTKTVTHSFGEKPQVTVLDSTGDEIEVEVSHTDDNVLVLTFVGTLTAAVVFCDTGV